MLSLEGLAIVMLKVSDSIVWKVSCLLCRNINRSLAGIWKKMQPQRENSKMCLVCSLSSAYYRVSYILPFSYLIICALYMINFLQSIFLQ